MEMARERTREREMIKRDGERLYLHGRRRLNCSLQEEDAEKEIERERGREEAIRLSEAGRASYSLPKN